MRGASMLKDQLRGQSASDDNLTGETGDESYASSMISDVTAIAHAEDDDYFGIGTTEVDGGDKKGKRCMASHVRKGPQRNVAPDSIRERSFIQHGRHCRNIF